MCFLFFFKQLMWLIQVKCVECIYLYHNTAPILLHQLTPGININWLLQMRLEWLLPCAVCKLTRTSMGQTDVFTRKKINTLMCNICRIYKKAQIIKNFSSTVFHKVYNVSSDATTLKIERFFLRESGDFPHERQKSSPYWFLFIVFVIFDVFTSDKMLSSLINLI